MPALLKKGEKVACVSPLTETIEIPKSLMKTDSNKEPELQTLILSSLENEQDPISKTERVCNEKLADTLEFTNPQLTEKVKRVATGLLLNNHDCFSLQPGELGRVRDIEVDIETGDARPIWQSPRCIAYHL